MFTLMVSSEATELVKTSMPEPDPSTDEIILCRLVFGFVTFIQNVIVRSPSWLPNESENCTRLVGSTLVAKLRADLRSFCRSRNAPISSTGLVVLSDDGVLVELLDSELDDLLLTELSLSGALLVLLDESVLVLELDIELDDGLDSDDSSGTTVIGISVGLRSSKPSGPRFQTSSAVACGKSPCHIARSA
jgi:hypothetical protein